MSLCTKRFSIKKECLASINQLIKSSEIHSDSSGHSKNLIVISDDSVESTAADHDVQSWTKCGSIVLSKKEKALH